MIDSSSNSIPILATVLLAVAILGVGGAAIATDHVAGQATDAADWPMEGHDSAQTGFNPAATGPEGEVGPDWIAVTGYGPGVTVADGWVFVAGGEREGTVSAYDPEDGDREWRTEFGDEISSKPQVADGMIYVHVVTYGGRNPEDDTHEIVALEADTGTVEWRLEVGDDRYPDTTLEWKTLTVADGSLYVAGTNYDADGTQAERFIRSLDTDGTTRWHEPIDSQTLERPAVTDGRVITSVDGGVLALDDADGSVLWHTPHPETQDVSPPAIDDGAVFVNARTPIVLDAESGDMRAELPVVGTTAQPIAVTDDRLFVTGNPDGQWMPTQLHAVDRVDLDHSEGGDGDAGTGAPVALDADAVTWSVGNGTELSTRPIASATTVFVGGQDGVVYAFDRESGNERWFVEVNRNYMINNEPVVVDETLYVGPVDNRVYALVEGGQASDPAITSYLSRLLPLVADFAGFFAVVALLYLGVGVVFGIVGGVALYGLLGGLGLSRTPVRMLSARIYREPIDELTRRQEFGGLLVGSLIAVLAVGIVSALTFGAFPINGLGAAIVVFGGAWLLLAYRLLPAHPDDLDREARVIRRQWGALLGGYVLFVGLVYPFSVFVILMAIYFV